MTTNNNHNYGISFPIQSNKGKHLIDLNNNINDDVKSQLLHLIFTPEGQRLRNPEFGTRLIEYLFDPNDNLLWEDVVLHIKEKVNKYIVGCSVDEILVESVDEYHVKVIIRYSVIERDGNSYNYQIEQVI